MAMEQGGDRPEENEGPNSEANPEADPEGWYFDLPSGAWERQEAKNRELRQRVISNLDAAPTRTDPFMQSQAPDTRARGGLFGLGKRKGLPEPPHETAGGTFRLQRGGPGPGFGDLPQQAADDDEWSTEPDLAGPLAHDSAEPAADDGPSGWDAPEDRVGAGYEPEVHEPASRTDVKSGDENVDSGDTISAMRAWATKREPAASIAVPATPESLEAEESGVEEAAEAEQPAAVVEPTSPGFAQRVHEEEPRSDDSETDSRWKEMFSTTSTEQDTLASMADWAKRKPEPLTDAPPTEVPSEIPEDFLKPFDWEREGDEATALAEPESPETADWERKDASRFTAREASPAELQPFGWAHDDDDASGVPEAQSMSLAIEHEDEIIQPEVSSAAAHDGHGSAWTDEPGEDDASQPEVTRAAADDLHDSAWTDEVDDDIVDPPLAHAPDSDFGAPEGTVAERPREKRPRGLARLFRRKKKDEEPSPEMVLDPVGSGDWLPAEEEEALAADATDERAVGEFAFDEPSDPAASAGDIHGLDEPAALEGAGAPYGPGQMAEAEEVDPLPFPIGEPGASLDDVPASALWPWKVTADEHAPAESSAIDDVPEVSVEPAGAAVQDAVAAGWDPEPFDQPVVELAAAVADAAFGADISGTSGWSAEPDEPSTGDAVSKAWWEAETDVSAEPRSEEISEPATDLDETVGAQLSPTPWWKPERASVVVASVVPAEEEAVWSFEPEEDDEESPAAPAEPVVVASVAPAEEEAAWSFEPEEDDEESPAAPVEPVVVASVVPVEEEAVWSFEPEEDDEESPLVLAEPVVVASLAPTDEEPAWSFGHEEEESVAAQPGAETEAPVAAATFANDDTDDPWATFMSTRESAPPVQIVPEPASPSRWDDVFGSASAPDDTPRDDWGVPMAEATPVAPTPEAAAAEADDPWAAIAAASGYEAVPPSGASMGRETPPTSADPEAEIVASLHSQLAAADAADLADDWTTSPRPPHSASRDEADRPAAFHGDPDEERDDVILRAFEEHAATADPEPAPSAPSAADAAAFSALLGADADELVAEPDTDAESRTLHRLQGWAPQRSVRTGTDRGNAPWEPQSDEDVAEHDPTIPLPGWAGSGGGEGVVPAPPWATDADGGYSPAREVAAHGHSRTKTLVRELVETGLLALLVFLAVRASFQNFKVDGSSMYPTLENGEFLIVNKLVYSEVNMEKLSNFVPFLDAGDQPTRNVFHGPGRGDIVVLVDPRKQDTDLIKRIIGLPGETVEIADGHVYINDHLLEEPYIKSPWHDNKAKISIPEGLYYVMGDNRDNSLDSRSSQVGFVPKDFIIGKAMLSYWPTSKFGLAPNEAGNVSEKDGLPVVTAQSIDGR